MVNSSNETYDQWKADKALFWSSLLFLLLLVILLSCSVYSFLNLRMVKGKIASVDVDVQKKTYLKLKLVANPEIYYQVYERRFFDPEIQNLHKNDEIRFSTFNSPEKKHAAISSLGDQTSFYYYPVFDINRPAGLMQVIYFYFYDNFILDILLIISFVAALYNGFYVFVKANWLIKGPVIALVLVITWMIIL